ncbi:MAG: NAD(P)/FAD-dependent oxidoreductase [Ferruginibacter sp.]|nr:NAD(P)/FAD-dependent oxidoreductase [Chitinophagaceae bacterium]
MTNDDIYDTAIVGGGLAGLALSIQLARLGHRIVLFEKEQYPFHKVCGEYISLEAWDFLTDLGVDLDRMKVPIITRLQVSSPNGKLLQHDLPLGGFGISRYKLDHTLAQLALKAGVVLKENTKVNDVVFNENEFIIDTAQQTFRAKLVCGTYGKRSNIDIKWKRPFTAAKSKLNNFIGVKYHIRGDYPANTIALHNFKNGYCGIVKIEDDKYNLCYLTTAANLQKSNGDIRLMEQTILSQNPYLKKIFTGSTMLSEAPLTISQISFDRKSQVENHVLMIGDAAGMITPLCGNGMSMALHGSKLVSGPIHKFLQGQTTREKMETRYSFQWQRQFARRLRTGRRIQRLFGRKWLSNMFIPLLKPFPRLVDSLIRMTHGKPF